MLGRLPEAIKIALITQHSGCGARSDKNHHFFQCYCACAQLSFIPTLLRHDFPEGHDYSGLVAHIDPGGFHPSQLLVNSIIEPWICAFAMLVN